MSTVLSLRQLNRATLARQMLLRREAVPVVEAVERLAGMQAQEPKPPFIGLWSRLEPFALADLQAAFHRREVIRATMMRGTLHLLSASDYLAFRAVFEPMLTQALRLLGDRAEGLDAEAVLLVAHSLFAERPHTFTEIRTRLLETFPEINDRALGFTVRMRLPLVLFPTDHDRWSFPGDAAFTLASEWLGKPHDPTGSLALVVRRYLAAFGPASIADFQEWSGLKGMKPLFTELRSELRVYRDEKNRELFDVPDGPLSDADVAAPPRFLPEFDNLVLAHSDRRRIIADTYRKALVTKNGRVLATFLWDGLARGFWRIERKRTVARLVLSPFETLPTVAVKALSEEGEALLRFVEEDATTFEILWSDFPLSGV